MPTVFGVLVEQTLPVPHPQLIVPPMPLSSAVPHFPEYPALEHVSAALQAPAPSAPVHAWFVHQHARPGLHVQGRSEPQPGSTGVFVTLHSPPALPLPAQAGAT